MDVLFEIFGHLRPLDLLHLSRTTKEFRRVLLHRSSISIWKSARENVPDLPECPASFSEPAYANFVFDTHCYVCLSPYVRAIDWRLGKRICSKCSKTSLVKALVYGVEFRGNNLIPRTYSKRDGMILFKAERETIEKRLKELSGNDKKEEYNAFVAQRMAYLKDLGELAPKLEDWAIVKANNRSEELDEARRDRKRAIIDKLTELGWGEEIESIPPTDDMSRLKAVKQPTRLTPRIWANIKDEMIAYMEDMKSKRIERERKALVMSRKRHAITVLREYKVARIPFINVMPEAPDFCAFPEVDAILELPNEVEVTQASFDNIVSDMDTLIERWRAAITRKLADAAVTMIGEQQSSSEGMDVDESHPLHLATTVFKCKQCHGYPMYDGWDSDEDDFPMFGMPLYTPRRRPLLYYPQVMGHKCLTRHQSRWGEFTNDPTQQLSDSMETMREPWSEGPLLLDDQASTAVRDIVDLCGMDPLNTTPAQLDELDPRLACLSCLNWSNEEENKTDAKVFGWRKAVQHQVSGHSGRGQILDWRLLEGDELRTYREKEAEAPASSSDATLPEPQRSQAVWKCVPCLDQITENTHTHSSVKTHLQFSHSITEPELNRDYMQMYGSDAERAELPRITLTMDRPDHVFKPGEKAMSRLEMDFFDWFSPMHDFDMPDYDSDNYDSGDY
ncbi:hypothetical protein CONPUDRAFT_79375 [Coniophora puteana RWD-64-598 SS2]|uniref:F-box domain-containing protein n=1 Tax=Coniophora puteana (strain RWD-64-598) TaxID=741705 RepID=A0A5M3N712_CONPW|nr:uncharacterized protein CONPUDRAFT_79375 [Coniophora puteana RWD-64-598 SS2]EIW87229.1 hypothetical protein CONPUDRAFT_79375 [Coniophora puteana RWD-64-598 SS2]